MKQEITATLQTLQKSGGERRLFQQICQNPLVYAHVFDRLEQSANSSIMVTMWDTLARISLQLVPLDSPVPEVETVDFRPFLMDNLALREGRYFQ